MLSTCHGSCTFYKPLYLIFCHMKNLPLVLSLVTHLSLLSSLDFLVRLRFSPLRSPSWHEACMVISWSVFSIANCTDLYLIALLGQCCLRPICQLWPLLSISGTCSGAVQLCWELPPLQMSLDTSNVESKTINPVYRCIWKSKWLRHTKHLFVNALVIEILLKISQVCPLNFIVSWRRTEWRGLRS